MPVDITKYIVPTSSKMSTVKVVKKYRSSKRTRRRRFTKRKTMRTSLNIVPTKKFMRLRYATYYTLSPTLPAGVATADYKSFRTSLYAPEYSGGHQPYIRDQMASFYAYYRVWGVKYRITFSNRSTGTSRIAVCIMSTAEGSTPSVLMYENFERPYVKRRAILGPDGSSPAVKTLFGYLSVPRIEGLTRNEFVGEASYEAAVGANPAKVVSLHAMADSTVAGSVDITVQLDFLVEFWGRPTQATS